ncbi:RelA/SpoT domain-containing protein [Rhizobium phaseoli]|uniref:RelA/SpoT domain-containing protein n=1 Tax=Rhizobium phaseoli TaxID=396 RepID=UPI000BE7D041|nr:RelA/SpoT domain-containing protein [Rhizobium phaseoli]PDS29259.1 (p)ppGpp synthetase [Rhizobium phaseoli]
MLTQEMVVDCTKEYHKAIDRMYKLLLIATEKLETELKRHKIMARVSGRVKTRDSLARKLAKWSGDETKKSLFTSKHDVFSVVGDLAAIRVMTYVEQDRERVASIAREIFTHRPGREDFEYEVKESSARIKKDESNHYRATHMQIRLRPSDLNEKSDNLNDDHCELQITSMLAHVWNEIEHDIVYKGDKSILSDDERSALESLGLLTKTGDNIIVNLINANVAREAQEQLKVVEASEELTSAEALSQALYDFYGEYIFGASFDFWKNNAALFAALKHLKLTSPRKIFDVLTPSHVLGVSKNDLKPFTRFCARNHQRPAFAKDTCDLLLVALLAKFGTELAQQKHQGMGPRPRQLTFALRWEAYISSRA